MGRRMPWVPYIAEWWHLTVKRLLDCPLEYGVGFEANGVTIGFFLQHSVWCRMGEGCIGPKEIHAPFVSSAAVGFLFFPRSDRP